MLPIRGFWAVLDLDHPSGAAGLSTDSGSRVVWLQWVTADRCFSKIHFSPCAEGLEAGISGFTDKRKEQRERLGIPLSVCPPLSKRGPQPEPPGP